LIAARAVSESWLFCFTTLVLPAQGDRFMTSPDTPEETTPATSKPADRQEQAPRQSMQLQVNDANAIACYANFCRVTGSPEELIIDFGLNPQPVGMPKDPIEVKQRIIVNFFTAKRLLAALQMSVQRHEAVFGVLETDIQKRLRPQVAAQMQQHGG
jgi:hypothetical protein